MSPIKLEFSSHKISFQFVSIYSDMSGGNGPLGSMCLASRLLAYQERMCFTELVIVDVQKSVHVSQTNVTIHSKHFFFHFYIRVLCYFDI
jgi:hypothetical protein